MFSWLSFIVSSFIKQDVQSSVLFRWFFPIFSPLLLVENGKDYTFTCRLQLTKHAFALNKYYRIHGNFNMNTQYSHTFHNSS